MGETGFPARFRRSKVESFTGSLDERVSRSGPEGIARAGGDNMGWLGILLIVLLVVVLLGGFGYARR
jgi:hypothetical protein